MFVCVEGKEKTRIGRKHLDWGPKDIFIVPSGQPVVDEAGEETVLFSSSDRPVQEELALWRENWDDFFCERSNRCQIRLARVVDDQDDVIEPCVPHHIEAPFRFDGLTFKGKSLHPLEVGRRFR